MSKTYNVKYEIKLKSGAIIPDKEINVKNCMSGVQAQIKLEGFLKKKYSDFKQLVVHSCTEDFLSQFGEIFGGGFTAAGGMFGKN